MTDGRRVAGSGVSGWSRPRLKTTREGKVFIAVTIGVGFAAVNTGNNQLYLVLGFLLSLIVLSGVMSEAALRYVRIERRLPMRAHAGSPMSIELAVTNGKKRRASYSIEIEDMRANTSVASRTYLLKVPPLQTETATYAFVPKARGTLEFTAFRIATRYPFGLFEKWRVIAAPATMLIFPELLACDESSADTSVRGAQNISREVGRGTEVASLREYRDGDEMRSVHWQRTASLGRTVVREYEREQSKSLVIRINNLRPSEPDSAWAAHFERTISQSAFLAHKALREGASAEIIARNGAAVRAENGARADALFSFLAQLEAVNEQDALSDNNKAAS